MIESTGMFLNRLQRTDVVWWVTTIDLLTFEDRNVPAFARFASRCFPLFLVYFFAVCNVRALQEFWQRPALTDRGVSGVGGWRSRGESVQVDHELCLHPVLLRLNRTCLGFRAQCRRNYEAPVLLKGQEVIEWGLYCETPETGQTTPETLDVAFRKHEKKKKPNRVIELSPVVSLYI